MPTWSHVIDLLVLLFGSLVAAYVQSNFSL
jgi:hypothetical protein